jgi:hypothetical protein
MATKKFSDYALQGQNVTLTYDNINDTVTFDVVVDKNDVGLGNVDNTSDANKPVSTAQQTALNLKQNSLVSGTNIKTLNSNTLLGSGDLVIDKTSVGLGNVANVDTTNATNITTGTLGDARLTANVTTQGNTFNAANKLVQLDGTAKLPAIDGSQLTNLPTPATPTLAAVTTAGNTTTNAITVGGLTVDTNTLFVDATNNKVGVGTLVPFDTLNVSGSSAPGISITSTTFTQSSAGRASLSLLRLNTATNAFIGWDLLKDVNDTLAIRYLNSAAAAQENVRLWTNGNVTIQSGGTFTDAGYRLDVNGSTRIKGAGSTGATNALIIENSASTNILTISNDGFATMQYLDAVNYLSISNIRSRNTNGIVFQNSASTVFMKFHNTGNFSINTTTDAGYKLDVNGTARVFSTASAFHLLSGVGSTSTATSTVKVDTIGGFFKAYGSGFSVGSLASKVAFGPDGANGIVVFSNAQDSSGSTGTISLRGGGYDTPAEMLFIDKTGSKFTNGTVIIGGSSTNTSAIFQIDSTTKGVLFPRMTTTQKNAIATPASGLVVYDTTLGKLCVYGAASWETITSI